MGTGPYVYDNNSLEKDLNILHSSVSRYIEFYATQFYTNVDKSVSLTVPIYLDLVRLLTKTQSSVFESFKRNHYMQIEFLSALYASYTQRHSDGITITGQQLIIEDLKRPTKTNLESVSSRLSVTVQIHPEIKKYIEVYGTPTLENPLNFDKLSKLMSDFNFLTPTVLPDLHTTST